MLVSKPIEQRSTADVTLTSSHSSHGWSADIINEAWSGIKGGARVAESVVTGVVNHAIEKPLETAIEVGVGVVAAGAIAEAGIGAVGATVIAAVPLAAYGAYRGIDIARTEGFRAIPEHLKQTYSDSVSTVSSAAKAIEAVYSGTADAAAMAKVESIGDAATPFFAGGIGGSSTLLGREVLRGAYSFGEKGLGLLAEQMWPRAPQLVPAFADGVPRFSTPLSMIGKDVSLAGTTSLGVGVNSAEILNMKSAMSDGFGDAPGEKLTENRSSAADSSNKSRISHYKEGKFDVTQFDPPEPTSQFPESWQRFFGPENLDKSVVRLRDPISIYDDSQYVEFSDGSWMRKQASAGREETAGPFKNFWIHSNGELADGTQWADTSELGIIKVKPDGTKKPHFETPPKPRSVIEAEARDALAAGEAQERIAGAQTRIAEAAVRRAEAQARKLAGPSDTTLADGSTISVYKDGSRTTNQAGTVTREYPDGTRYQYRGDSLSPRWSLTEKPDGTLIEKGSADRGRRELPDGTLYEYSTPDGYLTETKVDKHGKVQHVRPMDGWRDD